MHRTRRQPRAAAPVAPRGIARHRERLRRAGRGQRAAPRRQGHHLVLHRAAGFPDARPRAGRGDRGDPRRASTATRRARASTSCAPPRRRTWAAAAACAIRPDDVVIGAGAKPFIAYTIASVTDYGVGDEVIYPGAGLPDLRIADRRQRRGTGADLPARVAQLRVRSRGARSEDHAQDATADPQHAAEPDRRHPGARRTWTPSPRSCAGIRRCGCSPTRSTRASCTTAASTRSPRARACWSARSSATARPRPGR